MPGPDHGSADRAASTPPSGWGRMPEAQSGQAPGRVGWRFVTLYAVSYTGGSLLFLAPLLVTLALKVNDLVGIDAAPRNLGMVTGIGSLLSIVANPFFGRLSDRTT
jgi:MFS family permease